jgi:hypothetical protein
MGHFDKTLGYVRIYSQISCHGGCMGVSEELIKEWAWGAYTI